MEAGKKNLRMKMGILRPNFSDYPNLPSSSYACRDILTVTYLPMAFGSVRSAAKCVTIRVANVRSIQWEFSNPKSSCDRLRLLPATEHVE